MSKTFIAVGAVVVIVAIGGVYLFTAKDNQTGEPLATEVSTGDQADKGATKGACDIYTQAIAEQVPGTGAARSDHASKYNASSDDISVTNCLYSKDKPGSLGILTANVMVRGAKTKAGRKSNESGYGGNEDRSNLRAEGMKLGPTESISGLGDKAFWDPDFKQVNVLVGGGSYWLVVQAESRERSEQLAHLLVGAL